MTRHFPNQNGGNEFHQQNSSRLSNQTNPKNFQAYQQYGEINQSSVYHIQSQGQRGAEHQEVKHWMTYQNDVKVYMGENFFYGPNEHSRSVQN